MKHYSPGTHTPFIRTELKCFIISLVFHCPSKQSVPLSDFLTATRVCLVSDHDIIISGVTVVLTFWFRENYCSNIINWLIWKDKFRLITFLYKPNRKLTFIKSSTDLFFDRTYRDRPKFMVFPKTPTHVSKIKWLSTDKKESIPSHISLI